MGETGEREGKIGRGYRENVRWSSVGPTRCSETGGCGKRQAGSRVLGYREEWNKSLKQEKIKSQCWWTRWEINKLSREEVKGDDKMIILYNLIYLSEEGRQIKLIKMRPTSGRRETINSKQEYDSQVTATLVLYTCRGDQLDEQHSIISMAGAGAHIILVARRVGRCVHLRWASIFVENW